MLPFVGTVIPEKQGLGLSSVADRILLHSHGNWFFSAGQAIVIPLFSSIHPLSLLFEESHICHIYWRSFSLFITVDLLLDLYLHG